MRTIVVLTVLGLFSSAFGAGIFAATQDKNFGVFSELQNIESSDFGKKLLDTIALQLKNKAPLAEISKLLNDLHSDLVRQQDAADAQHAIDERDFTNGLNEYNSRIDFATNEINEALVEISTLKKLIAQATSQKESLETQLKNLGEREQQYREARRADEAAFVQRVQQGRAVISALEEIVPLLERLKPHGNVQQALVELAKIGTTNPLGALLQVAMTLDPGALQRAIQKLTKLKESLAAGIEDDIKHEEEEKRNFEKFLQEIEDFRENLNNALSQVRGELESLQSRLSTQENRLATNQRELKLATEGKAQLIEQNDAKRSRYNSESAARKSQRSVIEQVQGILASKLGQMQSYIKERVDN